MNIDKLLNESLRLRIAPQRLAAIYGRKFNPKQLSKDQFKKYLLVVSYIIESYRD